MRASVEDRLRELEEDVAALTRRVAALEGEARPGDERGRALGTSIDTVHPPATDTVGLLSLVGRTFVVFGGAYLLRALTESGYLPTSAGVLVGLASS